MSVVLAEDISTPERIEMILVASTDGNVMNCETRMFEPRMHDTNIGRGIQFWKFLLYIRGMNLNHYPVILKRE